MSVSTAVLLAITRMLTQAFKAGDTERQERLVRLMNDFEWAFPKAAEEVNEIYPLPHPPIGE